MSKWRLCLEETTCNIEPFESGASHPKTLLGAEESGSFDKKAVFDEALSQRLVTLLSTPGHFESTGDREMKRVFALLHSL